MVLDSALHAFFEEFHTGNPAGFSHIIRDAVRDVLHLRSQPHINGPRCLLQSTGDFLLAILETLSHFIRVFVSERHLPTYVRGRLQTSAREHDLTDLSDAKYMAKKHNDLLYVCILIVKHPR